MTTDHDVRANIQARLDAQEAWDLVKDQPARFWEHFDALRGASVTINSFESAVTQPMNEIQARAFEQEIVRFGKHKGLPVGEILEQDRFWLEFVAHGSEFSERCARYLAYADESRRIDYAPPEFLAGYEEFNNHRRHDR